MPKKYAVSYIPTDTFDGKPSGEVLFVHLFKSKKEAVGYAKIVDKPKIYELVEESK